ncbi:MAG: GNAT family N-acetyltransferase [Thermoguttaceae bacterium]|jgi:ribosomal protein S18 acetylase RimI-like enzyme
MFDPGPPRIAELSPDQEDLALRLCLGGLEQSQFELQVGMLRASVKRQPLSGYRIWGAFRESELIGSILVQTQAGRTAVIWPPRLVAGELRETAHSLLLRGIEDLPRLGIRVVQALLPTDMGTDAELLVATGFQHVSDLLYLVCLADQFPTSPPSPELQFRAYSPEVRVRFPQLVDATYEDSLDCPAVNGVRKVDDVLQGYRATGFFDPERWLIVCHQGDEIGCLILTDYPEHATWELIYMGLLPAARGRRWGVGIVRHAQWLCGKAFRKRLVLAVDAANEPALRMYAAAGFQSWDRTSVFIRVLDDNGSMTS